MLSRLLSHLLSHKGKKKKENPKAGTASNDHINYPLNSNHNFGQRSLFLRSISSSLSSFSTWSPSTVVSGQNLNAGHFSQPTTKAMGQIVMWFTPLNNELERRPVEVIIQELMEKVLRYRNKYYNGSNVKSSRRKEKK